MSNNYYTGATQLASVSVTTSPTVITAANSPIQGQQAITIPLTALGSYLYLLVVPAHGKQKDGVTAVDATYIQNYGSRWSVTDRVAQINVNDGQVLFGCTDIGTFTAYPTRWS